MNRQETISPAHAEALRLAALIEKCRKASALVLQGKAEMTAVEFDLIATGYPYYDAHDNLRIIRAVRSAVEFMRHYGKGSDYGNTRH